METETGSGKQTVFFVVMGQKNTTHKVWAKSETMRAGPLCRYFGAYMELLLTFISRKNFMLNWVEHEKSFKTSASGAWMFKASDKDYNVT